MHQFHQQLLDPGTYPEITESVVFKETHISSVYLTDNHAYKLKKPLNLGFLDFSSLEKRHHYCQEEVRLNRRFTTDTYLGVVSLRQQQGKISFCERGKLLDYAVKMRRLPEDRMLDFLLESNAPILADDMSKMGMALRKVVKNADICQHEPLRNVDVVKQNCTENFRQTSRAIGTSLSSEAHLLMQTMTRHELHDLEETMLEREVNGFVRDGHGDLHAANICMTDPVCIYDCIEFNRRFRVADIVADLAFLIMDLEFRKRRDLAETLSLQFQEHSDNHNFKQLLLFYKKYRAWVRGKVDTILATDPEASPSVREHAAGLARRYFNLALGYQLEPTLFLTSGLMGAGKTTLARALAHATGAKHLRSDVLRKQLAGLAEDTKCREAFGVGLYSCEKTKQTYEELFNVTAETIDRKGSVVVDASFAQENERKRFMTLAGQKNYPVWLVHLECPDEVTLRRLDQRVDNSSDGRRELFAQQKAVFSEIPPSSEVVKIDTCNPVDYNVQSLLCRALTTQEQLS